MRMFRGCVIVVATFLLVGCGTPEKPIEKSDWRDDMPYRTVKVNFWDLCGLRISIPPEKDADTMIIVKLSNNKNLYLFASPKEIRLLEEKCRPAAMRKHGILGEQK